MSTAIKFILKQIRIINIRYKKYMMKYFYNEIMAKKCMITVRLLTEIIIFKQTANFPITIS